MLALRAPVRNAIMAACADQPQGRFECAGGIAFDIGFEGASEKYYQQPAGRATLTRLVMDVATQQAR